MHVYWKSSYWYTATSHLIAKYCGQKSWLPIQQLSFHTTTKLCTAMYCCFQKSLSVFSINTLVVLRSRRHFHWTILHSKTARQEFKVWDRSVQEEVSIETESWVELSCLWSRSLSKSLLIQMHIVLHFYFAERYSW